MKGHCSCGEVRYEMTDSPLFVHACYCTNCQRQSGSTHALNAMIETKCLKVLTGMTEGIKVDTGSGMGQIIHRCPTCKIGVWSHYVGSGDDFSFVRVGSLENPGAYPPDINIFTRSKQPWVTLLADIPAAEEFYDPGECWPEAALLRKQAVIDARQQQVKKPLVGDQHP